MTETNDQFTFTVTDPAQNSTEWNIKGGTVNFKNMTKNILYSLMVKFKLIYFQNILYEK